jgi:hypothetical protein
MRKPFKNINYKYPSKNNYVLGWVVHVSVVRFLGSFKVNNASLDVRIFFCLPFLSYNIN